MTDLSQSERPQRRQTKALPGSAWDTWHKAGWDFAQNAAGATDRDIELAAVDYAMERPFRMSVVKRAFTEGARQNREKGMDSERNL